MTHYDFIYDENELLKTEELFLHPYPESLFTINVSYRPKKLSEETKHECENLPNKTFVIVKSLYPSRFINDKLQVIDGILKKTIMRNFNLQIGTFDPYEYNNINIPQQGFGIYFQVNPKNIDKAMRTLLDNCYNNVWTGYKYYLDDSENNKMKLEIKKDLYKSLNTKFSVILEKQKDHKWFHFETDTKTGVFEYLIPILRKYKTEADETFINKLIAIETMHGYHFLIKYTDIQKQHKQFCKDIYDDCPEYNKENNIEKMFTKHTGSVPLPGTLQFGFKVKYVDLKKIEI